MLESIEQVVKSLFKYVARVLRFTACSSKCYGSERTCKNDGGSPSSSSSTPSSFSSYIDTYRKLTTT